MMTERNERCVSLKALLRLIGEDEDHCPSCHEDDEDGIIELHDLELGRGADGKDRYCSVCCYVMNAYDDWKREMGT